MKLIKEHINEKFEEKDGDPIEHMGIGLPYEISKKIYALNNERNVLRISFHYDGKDRCNFTIRFLGNELEECTKLFNKYIDKQYVYDYDFNEIGSLTCTIDYYIKSKYTKLFLNAINIYRRT